MFQVKVLPLVRDWLCCCHHQCTGVVAINAQASLPYLLLRLSPLSFVIKLAALPLSLSLLLSSIAIVLVIIISPCTFAIIIIIIPRCAVAIIIDFVARRTITNIIVVVVHRAVAIVVIVSGERCASVRSDTDVVVFNQPVQKGQI